MQYKKLGKTNFNISTISLGTWQVGGKWGSNFNKDNADEILNTALDNGINFIDTADVYSNGESEKAIGRFLKTKKDKIFVATKCGRQIQPHASAGYTTEALQKFVEDSLIRLQIECIDLIQLHCPPPEVYYRPEIFELFDKLKQQGKINNLGVSVEKVEEGLKAIEYDNVTTVQIIFNMFRQRPAQLFFSEAQKKDIGIIVRVPLASGLLTGNYTAQTTFETGDHRNFNRNGEAFDKGETFAGINYETGLKAVEELKNIFSNQELATIALQWILQFDAVSCIIPGASNTNQVTQNLRALEQKIFTENELDAINAVYCKYIKPAVHHLW